jgi:hypothetical protein
MIITNEHGEGGYPTHISFLKSTAVRNAAELGKWRAPYLRLGPITIIIIIIITIVVIMHNVFIVICSSKQWA